MRFAIFGDIHANLEAFEAVLADAKEHGCSSYVCLGDVVGYNSSPNECMDIVQSLGCPVVKGNHDEYASTSSPVDNFNPLAEAAILWTREKLNPKEKKWLFELPLVTTAGNFTIVHATLDDPAGWGYVLNQLDAAASFSRQETQICFFGHTHATRLYVRDNSVIGLPLTTVRFESQKKYFVNVGSVGQPRDGDWRAAYAVFDSEASEITLRRLHYDIVQTQGKILEAGLPFKLAERLQFGR